MSIDEWQRVDDLDLSGAQVAVLAASPAMEIRPSPNGRWSLTAKNLVGVVHADGLEIRIQPKVEVGRLLELLCETIERVEWHEVDTEWSVTEDLLATIAGSFCTQVERVLAQGLLQGYRTIDEAIYGVKGRIDVGAQLSRQAGMTLPVNVTYDDYSEDIVENQILAGATEVLLRLPVPDVLRIRLRRARVAFVDIGPCRPSSKPPVIAWTRLNLRYKPAVVLARLVLKSAAIDDLDERDTTGTNFLVDMNKVFEDVVGRGLKDHVEATGQGTVKLQEQVSLDDDGHLQIRPDVVWEHGAAVRAVADIKYKQPDEDGTKTSDVYQALAYTTRYGLDRCALIYGTPPRMSSLRVRGATIDLFSVELGASGEERARRIAEIAERMSVS